MNPRWTSYAASKPHPPIHSSCPYKLDKTFISQKYPVIIYHLTARLLHLTSATYGRNELSNHVSDKCNMHHSEQNDNKFYLPLRTETSYQIPPHRLLWSFPFNVIATGPVSRVIMCQTKCISFSARPRKLQIVWEWVLCLSRPLPHSG